MEGTDEEVLSTNTRNEYVEAIEIGDFFECGKLIPPAIRNFQSREELLKYVRGFSLSQGYATTIRDSKKDKYVTIGCDRGGIYRNRMNTPVEERKRMAYFSQRSH
ncbi:Methylmalonate-semialdehyde dehydrogenase [Thalictrum thalictroides]|uniref:Methylmalonate-semialdehyde dehydrogenase n=1 Tax=Thalictrum thalictroides TaxID=46969 RepID=A0A7J6UV78_THATH|nr:Methylmalonate-semialdehyde dehydrogenase [Thalictrum thalictroides]